MQAFIGRRGWFTLLLVAVMALSGCERGAEVADAGHQLEPIAPGDECEVCGMLIDGFPGPKGQAFIRQRSEPLKFCSTVDLWSWMLQPEIEGVLEAAYVHDMTAVDWARPNDDRYVDARAAWYVAGHSQRGAMGPTLASFATEAAAADYAARFGGRSLSPADIDLELLAGLSQGADAEHAHGAHRH